MVEKVRKRYSSISDRSADLIAAHDVTLDEVREAILEHCHGRRRT